jgi:hypothetical protein
MPVDLKKDSMGSVIDDFYKSNAPQFKGKSKKKRRQMAIAAKLSVESALYFQEAQRHWSKGYDSGDKTVPRRKALDRAEYFDNRGENERAHKIRRIAISKDHGDDYEARRKAKNIKISNKVGKLPTASIDDKRGAVSGDVQKKLKEQNFNAPGTTAIRFQKDFGLGSGGGSELKVTHGGADIYKRTTTNPKPVKTSPKDVVDTALSNFNNKVSEGKLDNVMNIVRKYSKKKEEKKPEPPTGAEKKIRDWRKKARKRDHETVNFLDPDD